MSPLVDGALGNPYPTIETIMNQARVRVNDASNDISGDLLTDDAPYTPTILNTAWRWLQGRAYTAGVETYLQEVVIYNFPVRASNDPSYQAFIGWQGCGDGQNQYESPALPQDLIQPLSIWSRPSVAIASDGTQPTNEVPFRLMTQATDGLPVWLDPCVYDWRQDGLYFFAQTFTQDYRIRYAAYRANLDITQPNSLVPMMMCEDVMSARVAYEYANLRGAAQAPAMMQMSEDAFGIIAQRTSRRKQRQSIRRQGYSGRLSNTRNIFYPNIPSN